MEEVKTKDKLKLQIRLQNEEIRKQRSREMEKDKELCELRKKVTYLEHENQELSYLVMETIYEKNRRNRGY